MITKDFFLNSTVVEFDDEITKGVTCYAGNFRLTVTDITKVRENSELELLWVCGDDEEMYLVLIPSEQVEENYTFEWVDVPDLLEQVKIYYKK